MAGSEDYLDGLLNSVTKKLSEIDEASESQKDAYLPPKTNKALNEMREDQFLKEFEADLGLGEDEDFLTEFEKSLDSQEEKRPAEDSLENFDLSGIDDEDLELMDDDETEDFLKEAETTASADDAGFSDGSDSIKFSGSPEPELGALPEPFDTEPETVTADEEAPPADETGAAPEGMKDLESLFDAPLPLSDEDEETIIDEEHLDEAIEGMELEDSEDAALAEIGRMLNSDSDDFHIDEDNLADPDSFASAQSATQARMAEQEEGKKGKKEKKEKGGGFFSKLLSLLFGDDSEDEGIDIGDADVNSAEVLTAETDKVLDDMAAEDAKGEGEDDKKKKKEKKEKPKKEPKPKKEKPKKEPKPKKEKKKEPKGKPLPKLPVILIVVIAASLFVLIYMGTNVVSKSNYVTRAKESYDKGNYIEAYKALEPLDRNESEEELYNRSKTLAVIQTELEAYYSLVSIRKYDLAIDCLIRGLGRCEIENLHAEEWGCVSQMNMLKKEIEKQLADQYSMTPEEALEIYAIEDRDDYSVAIHRVLEGLGLRYN